MRALLKERDASVAQLVEQRTENPRVVGSIPTGGTNKKSWNSASRQSASVAHLVERHLAKVEVASSSLVTRSKKTTTPKGRPLTGTTTKPNRAKQYGRGNETVSSPILTAAGLFIKNDYYLRLFGSMCG